MIDGDREFIIKALRGDITTDAAYDVVKAARALDDDGKLRELDSEAWGAFHVGNNRHLDDPRRFERIDRTWEPDIDVDPATVEALEARRTPAEAPEDNGPDPEPRWWQREHPEDIEGVQRRIVLTRASDIPVKRVRWLWEGRLALGTLGLLAGPEGLGKSTLAYERAARITRGQLPGEHYGTPKGVLVCATEDSWEHTIVPRLMAHDADLTRVYRVEVVVAESIHVGLTLPADLLDVERAARQVDAALLILDPLMSRLDAGLDSHKDGEVRRALEPLVSVADRTGMAIIGLIHHNKSGATDPLALVMASKAFTAVARSVHTAMRDPEDDTGKRRLFGTPKNNLGRDDLPTMTFTIGRWTYQAEDGEGETGQLVWGEDSDTSIRDALANLVADPESRSATDEAKAWLEDYLAVHHAGLSKDIRDEARKVGHAKATLDRARRKAGIATYSHGFPRRSYWCRKGMTPDELDAWLADHDETTAQSGRLPVGSTRSVITPGHTVGSPLGESDPTEMTEMTESTGSVQSSQSPQSPQSPHSPPDVSPLDTLTA